MGVLCVEGSVCESGAAACVCLFEPELNREPDAGLWLCHPGWHLPRAAHAGTPSWGSRLQPWTATYQVHPDFTRVGEVRGTEWFTENERTVIPEGVLLERSRAEKLRREEQRIRVTWIWICWGRQPHPAGNPADSAQVGGLIAELALYGPWKGEKGADKGLCRPLALLSESQLPKFACVCWLQFPSGATSKAGKQETTAGSRIGIASSLVVVLS